MCVCGKSEKAQKVIECLLFMSRRSEGVGGVPANEDAPSFFVWIQASINLSVWPTPP